MIQSFHVPVRDNSVYSSFRRQQIGFCAHALDKDGCHEILQFGFPADTHSGAPTGKTVVTENTGAHRRHNIDLGYRMNGVSRREEEECASNRSWTDVHDQGEEELQRKRNGSNAKNLLPEPRARNKDQEGDDHKDVPIF